MPLDFSNIRKEEKPKKESKSKKKFKGKYAFDKKDYLVLVDEKEVKK